MPKILVIDDDRAILTLVRNTLAGVADLLTADTAAQGLQMLRQHQPDAVLLDILLPDRNGLAMLGDVHQQDRRLPVIFMTSEADSETAIEAMQLGAFDYIAKPLETAALRSLMSRAIEQRELSSLPVAIVAEDKGADGEGKLFIGSCPKMLEVFKSIGRVSKQQVPVLIRGESGTGKELVARALYHYSERADQPFVAVNCAALPETLLESELFGHEKGAFTGADSRRIGKFEQCQDGTLLLDEIGDMSPMVQAKVLRVLQDQRFERVGGNNELKTNVRIVAATNQPLEKMVEAGTFREDLLYRLNAITIPLPPLRQRASDIPLLIQHFLNQAKREFHKHDLKGAAPETVELLTSYFWPGNVRQLRAVIRRCVLESVLPVILPNQLPPEIRSGGEDLPPPSAAASWQQPAPDVAVPPPAERWSAEHSIDGQHMPALVDELLQNNESHVYAKTMAYAERYVILRVLCKTDGNQSRAAEILGITRGKLRDRIATYHIKLESGVTIG